MKHRFIFIIGLLLLITIVWATTMLGIEYNSKNDKPAFVVLNCKYTKPLDKNEKLNIYIND